MNRPNYVRRQHSTDTQPNSPIVVRDIRAQRQQMVAPVWLVTLLAGAALSGCDIANVEDVKLVGIDLLRPQMAHGRNLPQQLRVVVSTNSNLRAIAGQHKLNLYSSEYFCEKEDAELIAGALTDKDGPVRLGSAAVEREPGPHVYWVDIRIAWKPNAPALPDEEKAYDLAVETRDLCIELHGEPMFGRGFTTNRIEVSASEVRRVIAGGR